MWGRGESESSRTIKKYILVCFSFFFSHDDNNINDANFADYFPSIPKHSPSDQGPHVGWIAPCIFFLPFKLIFDVILSKNERSDWEILKPTKMFLVQVCSTKNRPWKNMFLVDKFRFRWANSDENATKRFLSKFYVDWGGFGAFSKTLECVEVEICDFW